MFEDIIAFYFSSYLWRSKPWTSPF